MMTRMKLFEMGTVVLFTACFLRTCCIEETEETSQKGFETEFFSKCFDDNTISIVRTRRLYSYDPVRWENPIPYDEGVFVKKVYVSMSNMYAIVVIDSKADEWVFKRGTADCPFFYNDMTNIENFCIYNAKSDTLKPCDDRGLVMGKVVDLEELFNRHKSCPCIFFGNGKRGVLFWRGGLTFRWRHDFTTLLWVGRPVEYYTTKKFKTWNDFMSWDCNLEQRSTKSDNDKHEEGQKTEDKGSG